MKIAFENSLRNAGFEDSWHGKIWRQNFDSGDFASRRLHLQLHPEGKACIKVCLFPEVWATKLDDLLRVAVTLCRKRKCHWYLHAVIFAALDRVVPIGLLAGPLPFQHSARGRPLASSSQAATTADSGEIGANSSTDSQRGESSPVSAVRPNVVWTEFRQSLDKIRSVRKSKYQHHHWLVHVLVEVG